MSRKHAEIHCSENEYYVIDLSSLNGTFVNGNRVSKSQILEGDLVTFGKISLTFSFEAVTKIDADNGIVEGRVVAEYDDDNFVNGNFTVTYCLD